MMTWSCHICRDVRPDDKISVFKTDVSEAYGMPEGTMHQNVRYCNDRPMCVSKSKTWRLFNNPE